MYAYLTRSNSLFSTPFARSMLGSHDRSATASLKLTQKLNCKDFVNVYELTFTFPWESVFTEIGKLVSKFLARIVADRGKEGSDIVNGQSPKDLDTIAACAYAKATIVKIIKRKIIALPLLLPGRTQLFSNCLSIVMRSLCFCAGDVTCRSMRGISLCLVFV
jgi:hypothetical protein